MPLSPITAAIEDIHQGKMIILVDDEDRENEGDLIVSADAATPEAIAFMATYGRGLVCLALEPEKLDQLQIPMMPTHNHIPFGAAFTVSIEAIEGVTTGISAQDRAHTVKSVIAPGAGPADWVSPGHMFPLRAHEGGVLARNGHTEASIELARLGGRHPSAVICEIMKDDGKMARLPELEKFAQEHDLGLYSIEQLVDHLHKKKTDKSITLTGESSNSTCASHS